MLNSKMLVAVLLAGVSVSHAAFVPAHVTKSNQSPVLTDVRERTASQIAARSAAGYHYASVDMDGATWRVENQIKRELEALGYFVDYDNSHNTFGWNSLNGALLIKWQ